MESELLIPLSLVSLLLPLLGFITLILLGKRLPRQGDWLGTALLATTFGIACLLLFTKLTKYAEMDIMQSFNWIVIGSSLEIELGILIDNLTVVMMVVVTLVSTLVHLFSIRYMEGDIRYSRYYAYLGLFTFSMLGIVLTNNLLMMYIFWELVGICSYLLIGHWYEKKSASNAASKAFIVNRVGDAGMFMGIMILFANFSTFTFESIFDAIASGQLPFQSSGWMTAAGILLFCGAVGKSAQFPLHVWLPDAMEGPTPISALIHAATMVAAGVYLVARIFPLLTADALLVIAYIGAITALIAGTIAVTQFDFKKILAYSTISQLGYMILGLGVGAYTAGFMHLVTHAAFKAGLFLAAGSVIYAMHNALHEEDDHSTDAQDIRNMGGLKSKMPITYWTFMVFTLAISGIPFTSGFLSKDEILAGSLAFGTLSGHYILPIIGFLVAGLTAFYMFRLLILAFHGKPASHIRLSAIKESPWVMTLPLVVLATLSLFIFYSFNPFGAASGWFFEAIQRPASVVPALLQPINPTVLMDAIHHVHGLTIVLSIASALAGIGLAIMIYQWNKISAAKMASHMGFLYKGSYNKWYFDEIYDRVFVKGVIGLTKILHWFDDHIIDAIVNGAAVVARKVSGVSRWIDTYVVDGVVNGSARVASNGGALLSRFQAGKLQTYLVYLLFSFILLFILFI